MGETVVEQIKPFRIDYFYTTENNIKGKRVNLIEMSNADAIEHAKKLVSNSKKITAFTGAGISVDSGIPDFRSDGGLWERFEPHEYATIESFKKNPTKFWTMGRALAKTILQAKPNSAHIGLSKLESNKKLIGIITLNIDNLHQASGNKRIVELRGNYLRAYCVECNKEYVGETVHQRVANGEIPPRCDVCKGVLKSEAILFGEPLPENAMREAIELCRNTDLMLVIGTSMSIYPAAYLPQLAKNEGAKIVLINLEGINRNDVADIVIRGRATEIIPKLVEY